jgi:hypothetical protein
MALAMALPIAAQTVIAMFFRKGLVFRKQVADLKQKRFETVVPGRRFGALIVALES